MFCKYFLDALKLQCLHEKCQSSFLDFVRLLFSLVIIQIKCDVGDASTLRKKGARELFEIVVNSRYYIDIPVDEDQEASDPKDSSISMNFNTLAPY